MRYLDDKKGEDEKKYDHTSNLQEILLSLNCLQFEYFERKYKDDMKRD